MGRHLARYTPGTVVRLRHGSGYESVAVRTEHEGWACSRGSGIIHRDSDRSCTIVEVLLEGPVKEPQGDYSVVEARCTHSWGSQPALLWFKRGSSWHPFASPIDVPVDLDNPDAWEDLVDPVIINEVQRG